MMNKPVLAILVIVITGVCGGMVKADAASIPLLAAGNDKTNNSEARLAAAFHTIVPIGSAILIEDKDARAILYTYGIIVGPAMGNYYCGDAKRGINGILLRLAGGGIIIVGSFFLIEATLGELFAGNSSHSSEGNAGMIIFTCGGLTALGSVIYNYATIPKSVQKHNDLINGIGISLGASRSRDKLIPQIRVTAKF